MNFPLPITELNAGIMVSLEIIQGTPGFEFLLSPITNEPLFAPVSGEQLIGADQ